MRTNIHTRLYVGSKQPARHAQGSGSDQSAAAQQSQLHANRYKQIRNDYNRLLYKCVRGTICVRV
jgi:hypothetical protein